MALQRVRAHHNKGCGAGKAQGAALALSLEDHRSLQSGEGEASSQAEQTAGQAVRHMELQILSSPWNVMFMGLDRRWERWTELGPRVTGDFRKSSHSGMVMSKADYSDWGIKGTRNWDKWKTLQRSSYTGKKETKT